jgi:hypothetical protein
VLHSEPKYDFALPQFLNGIMFVELCSSFGRFDQLVFSMFGVGVLSHPLVNSQSLPGAPFVCRHAPAFHEFFKCNLALPESTSSQDYLRLLAKYGSPIVVVRLTSASSLMLWCPKFVQCPDVVYKY